MANAKPTEVVAARAATNEKSQSLNESEDSKSAAKSSQGFRGVVSTNSVPSTKNAAKFESDDTTTASETNANTMRRRKSLGRKTISNIKQQNATPNTTGNNNNNNNLDNPVENIRKQLEKLEHLGDQLPSNETAYTLRYPFQDKGDGPSEQFLR